MLHGHHLQIMSSAYLDSGTVPSTHSSTNPQECANFVIQLVEKDVSDLVQITANVMISNVGNVVTLHQSLNVYPVDF